MSISAGAAVASAPSSEPGEVITWDYRPGSVTPLTQTERRDLRHASQPDIDECFYAIVTDLIGTPSELVGVDGNLAGYQQHTLWGTTIWKPGGAATPLRFPASTLTPKPGCTTTTTATTTRSAAATCPPTRSA